MENDKTEDQILLPHHEQQELCTTRLPYRQGRKLTAVKVYSITKESNHLLIFGVPSLHLRQEAKALFLKFGKLLQFNVSKDHAAEAFTETYHACYERIQSARVAKKILDTKNFYGGSLHVCYAPEMESIQETQQKLIQRQNDVLFRLRNLQSDKAKEQIDTKPMAVADEIQSSGKKLLNMGETNVISTGKDHKRHKRKIKDDVAAEKRFKPCFVDNNIIINEVTINDECLVKKKVTGVITNDGMNNDADRSFNNEGNDRCLNNTVGSLSSNVKRSVRDVTEVEIVDCTSVDKTTISNINEALNYDKFGEETILKLPTKPVNKIKFNLNKKSLI